MISSEALNSIIDIINERRSWISATREDRPIEFLYIENGYPFMTYGRGILLTSYRPYRNYKSGYRWRISEHKVGQAIIRLSLMDIRFTDRLRLLKLSLEDVENIIRIASDNLINLQLDDVAFFND